MVGQVKRPIESLLQARLHDPFGLLGLHREGAEWVVRVYEPYATEVGLLDHAGPATLKRTHPAGIFEWRGSNERDGPAMGTLDATQGLHAVQVAVPCAAVDLVGPDHLPHEFLEYIQIFVRAAGRDETPERIRAVGQLQAGGLFGDIFQCIFPGGLGQFAVTPDQRLCEAVGMAGGMEAEEATGAEVAVVASGSMRRIDLDEFVAQIGRA